MLELKAEDVSGVASNGNRNMKNFAFETTFNSRRIAHSLRKVLSGNLRCEKERLYS